MRSSEESNTTSSGKRSPGKVLARSLLLRCPSCGQSSIVERPFHVKHHCSNCQALFKREEGFFVGAILANVLTTELAILVTCGIWLGLISSNYESLLVILLFIAALFPLSFFHHSWSFWLAFDHLIEGLPRFRQKAGGKP